jgi:Na+/proline symporter
MYFFSVIIVFVNLQFLVLGALLLIYGQAKGISVTATDELFPTVAFKYLGTVAGVVFLIGLISASFPSLGGALTALTTSVSIDFLRLDRRKNLSESASAKIRYSIHFIMAVIFLICILIFKALNDEAVIDKLFTIAGYTYGPLLGLFTFGLFTTRKVKDKATPVIAILCPVSCYFISMFSEQLFFGYKFGWEILLVNGFLVFMGLLIFSRKGGELQRI